MVNATDSYLDGYRTGMREATEDRWTARMARAFVTDVPHPVNDFERGFERGVLETTGVEPVADLAVVLACRAEV